MSEERVFYPGWFPESAEAAESAFFARGQSYAFQDFQDDRPLPPALSLAKFRLWPQNQGPVGTCWENAACQAFQIHTAADGTYEPTQLSRCMIGWQGKKLDGGGNPDDGGSVLNGFLAMSDPPNGVGVCHEEKWPYKPDRRYFAKGPPEGAVEDAGLNRVHQVTKTKIGDDWKRNIFNGHPVGVGIWWPKGWDTRVDATGRVTGIGGGRYGHALAVIGWINDWDGYLWWQIENSHGAIYHPIPTAIAARIPGYVPATASKTFDFWVRDDWLRKVMGYGGAEQVVAAGLTGFVKRPKMWTFADLFA